MLVIVMLLNN